MLPDRRPVIVLCALSARVSLACLEANRQQQQLIRVKKRRQKTNALSAIT